jgi:glyoxylase-like metal-dependent hydrolase (beta-lactamase superfamily II)
MEEVFDKLYATTPEAMPGAPSLGVRSFLLRREAGNLLLYGTGIPAGDVREIEGMGGVARHYLNHHHEAAFVGDGLVRTLGAPLFCHEDDSRSAAETLRVAGTFSGRHFVGEDFEVIPTPGHTEGATAFLWGNGGHRFLFAGDTIYLRGGEWAAAVLPSSDGKSYADSLELIRGLDFDVLVPWLASVDGSPFAVTDKADRERRIGAILDRVRGGEDR